MWYTMVHFNKSKDLDQLNVYYNWVLASDTRDGFPFYELTHRPHQRTEALLSVAGRKKGKQEW